MLNIGDQSTQIIWLCEENEQFNIGSKPNWLNDGRRILVSFSDFPATHQQLFLIDIKTGLNQKNRNPIPVQENFMRNIRLHSEGKSFVFLLSQRNSKIWEVDVN